MIQFLIYNFIHLFTIGPFISQYWQDYYLQWNASEYPGVSSVRFPDSLIWKPDILLYNR